MVDTSRRSFLGFLGASAAFGKSTVEGVAKGLADSKLSESMRLSKMVRGAKNYGSKAQMGEASSSEWKEPSIEERVGELRNEFWHFLNPSKYKTREEVLENRFDRACINTDGLKSISNVHKFRMMEQLKRRISVDNEKNRYKRQLSNVLAGRRPYSDY